MAGGCPDPSHMDDVVVTEPGGLVRDEYTNARPSASLQRAFPASRMRREEEPSYRTRRGRAGMLFFASSSTGKRELAGINA